MLGKKFKTGFAHMFGDKNVASLLSTTGMLCLSNTGFCHFCPIKSEALPMQRKMNKSIICGNDNNRFQNGNVRMKNAYIVDAIRTPFGRYAGGLAPVRADDLGALPIQALMQRNPSVDWKQVDDVIYGCANQAGEDNRNVGRMSALLAGLPVEVPATTINRLCGSSLDAIAIAARAIKAGEANLIIAGGVESMSRAPFVMGKSESAYGRSQKIEDTTMGWRFINPKLKAMYGVETMPQTAENVAQQFNIDRADQDQFALTSQQRTATAQAQGFFKHEIIPVSIPQRKGGPIVVDTDEHPRASTTLEC